MGVNASRTPHLLFEFTPRVALYRAARLLSTFPFVLTTKPGVPGNRPAARHRRRISSINTCPCYYVYMVPLFHFDGRRARPLRFLSKLLTTLSSRNKCDHATQCRSTLRRDAREGMAPAVAFSALLINEWIISVYFT